VSLCVCAACFSPRARVLIYEMLNFRRDRVVGVLFYTTTFFF
jgi:hypothetical protein